MSFIQPPFWSQGAFRTPALHAVSVLVTPAVPIVSSSIANPTVLTTSVAHGLASGDTATIAGHAGSTPAVDGARLVTVLSPTTFSVPVSVTVAGAGGTVTRTIAIEPVSLDELKVRARLPVNDAEDGVLTDYIRAARSRVELDTGLALLAQTRDLYLDGFPYGRTLKLPAPLQAVISVQSTDTAGVVNTLNPTNYVVDVASGRIGLSVDGSWPSDLRYVQPVVIRVVVGRASVAQLEPLLVHAVGLLAAHYATLGRDLASVQEATDIPMGYDDAISAFLPVTVA